MNEAQSAFLSDRVLSQVDPQELVYTLCEIMDDDVPSITEWLGRLAEESVPFQNRKRAICSPNDSAVKSPAPKPLSRAKLLGLPE